MVKDIEMDSRMVVTVGWGMGSGQLVFNGYKISHESVSKPCSVILCL